MPRKKARTAAQKRATRKLIAFNKARRKGKRKSPFVAKRRVTSIKNPRKKRSQVLPPWVVIGVKSSPKKKGSTRAYYFTGTSFSDRKDEAARYKTRAIAIKVMNRIKRAIPKSIQYLGVDDVGTTIK